MLNAADYTEAQLVLRALLLVNNGNPEAIVGTFLFAYELSRTRFHRRFQTLWLLVIKQTTRIKALVRRYVVTSIRCYSSKNFGCKRKGGKAVCGDHVAVPHSAHLLVKLMTFILRYMFRDKAIPITRMTMVVKKPRMCQRERRPTDRRYWPARRCNSPYEGRDLFHFSAHPGIPAWKDQNICKFRLGVGDGKIRKNVQPAHTFYWISCKPDNLDGESEGSAQLG